MENTNNKRAINKAARLAWLLFYRLSGGDMSKAEYARLFGIHPSNAGIDEDDLEALRQQIDATFPHLETLLGQVFTPEDLQELPIHSSPTGECSEISVNFRVNHRTGELEWDPFIQKIYKEDGKKIAEIRIKRGGSKVKEKERIW
jgi:hypothetical protein